MVYAITSLRPLPNILYKVAGGVNSPLNSPVRLFLFSIDDPRRTFIRRGFLDANFARSSSRCFFNCFAMSLISWSSSSILWDRFFFFCIFSSVISFSFAYISRPDEMISSQRFFAKESICTFFFSLFLLLYFFV